MIPDRTPDTVAPVSCPDCGRSKATALSLDEIYAMRSYTGTFGPKPYDSPYCDTCKLTDIPRTIPFG